MNPDWKTEWLAPLQIPLANKFIRRCQFRGRIRPHDQCIVLRNQQTDIVAVASLRKFDNCELLTAVAVDPDFQNQGCAKRLLTDMKSEFGDATYTFSLEHLCHFYEQFGFRVVQKVDLPGDLSVRFTAYEKQGRNMKPMVFRH